MKVNTIIDGKSLKEYLFENLVSNTYRDLIKDEYFREKTGIYKLGTLTYHAKKMGVNLESIYNYAIDNLLIPQNMSFEKWYENTRGRKLSKNSKKGVTEKDIWLKICKDNGFDGLDDSFSKEVLKSTLKDFYEIKELNKMYNEYKNKMEK